MKRGFWLTLIVMLILPPNSATAQSCSATLTDSGPLEIRENGRIVENLRITSTNGDAIRIVNATDVIIRNVEIFHAGGAGIRIQNADRTQVDNVSITNTGAPPFGENPSIDLLNIFINESSGVRISRARLWRGSSGIYLFNSPDAHMSWIEGHDFRGPYPRGQLVQFSNSDRGILEDFSVENPQNTSYSEDNINVFHSSDIVIRRGLIDGNNSTNGAAITSEHADGQWSGLLVEDVDAIRMGHGSFFAYPGHNVTFRRVRTKDNICVSQNRRHADGSKETRGPSSGGVIFGAESTSTGVQLLEAQYWNPCNPRNIVYDKNAYDVQNYAEADFKLRDPVRLNFCWETGSNSAPKPPTNLSMANY